MTVLILTGREIRPLRGLCSVGLNENMAKTQKELAYLQELYVERVWTRRFTDLIDKYFNFDDAENLLYLNAGTGDHAFALRERIDDKPLAARMILPQTSRTASLTT